MYLRSYYRDVTCASCLKGKHADCTHIDCHCRNQFHAGLEGLPQAVDMSIMAKAILQRMGRRIRNEAGG